jgi:CO/xanthine dehydrogenase Mo-binding subunit
MVERGAVLGGRDLLPTSSPHPWAVATAVDRRRLLTRAGALLLAFQLPATGRAQPATPPAMLTAWVRIAADGRVTLLLSQAEIGQGISPVTSAPTKAPAACRAPTRIGIWRR